jgi:hypothetical protein
MMYSYKNYFLLTLAKPWTPDERICSFSGLMVKGASSF